MKYLNSFDTQSEYDAVKQRLKTPNVSLIDEDGHVEYIQYVPPIVDGHEYVEIDGIKWATMNLGADRVTDYGLYFAWGETSGYTPAQIGTSSGQRAFKWEEYKYWTGDTGSGSSGVTKYNSDDGKVTLEASDDPVTAAWGENWRMATAEEFASLSAATTSAWTNGYNGSVISGLVLTDKEDETKQLFLPANGMAYTGRVRSLGSYSRYWTKTIYSDNPINAILVTSNDTNINWRIGDTRYKALPIRGVVAQQ